MEKLKGVEPKLAKESYGIFRKLLRGKFCMNNASSGLSETCAASGNEECYEGLICDYNYSRGSVCTKECNLDEDCSSYSSCSLTFSGEKLCRPAMNGIGDRTGILGDSCFDYGDSDCQYGFLCLSSSIDDRDAFCTNKCQTDAECGDGFYCYDIFRDGNSLCVKGEKGKLGSSCYNRSCENENFCNISKENDYTATCTKLCDNVGEECDTEGYYCNKVSENYNICLENIPQSEGALGDLCMDTACEFALNCIYDENGNFCSQRCSANAPCPIGFECNVYDENNSFCYILK
jgi:hypothetical protein